MEPLTSLSTALTATKTLLDLLRSDKPDMARIGETLIDLQSAVLHAHERGAALTADKRRIEEELVRLRDWKEELLSDYRLENIAPGASVYVHLPSRHDLDAAHWLCQPCADTGVKSVLQLATAVEPFGTFVCWRCRSRVKAREIRPGGDREKEPSVMI